MWQLKIVGFFDQIIRVMVIMLVKVNYDPEGNILGYYPDDINYPVIPEPYIEIDTATHQDCIQNPGLRRVDIAKQTIVDYTPPEPTAEELLQRQLSALDAEYDPQFDALTLAWATASMEGDEETVAARKADKEALKAQYSQAREAILNG